MPSMRMIVDLANLDASRWIQLTGNSGHAFHAELRRPVRAVADRRRTCRCAGTGPTIEAAATDVWSSTPDGPRKFRAVLKDRTGAACGL